MAKCDARDAFGDLVSVVVHGYRSVRLADEDVLFACTDVPGSPLRLQVIEYQSGEATHLRGPATPESAVSLLNGSLDFQIKSLGEANVLARIHELRETEWSIANEVDF